QASEPIRYIVGELAGQRAKLHGVAVVEDDATGEDVVTRAAVERDPRPAGVDRQHATKRRSRRACGFGRDPPAVALQSRSQSLPRDARLDANAVRHNLHALMHAPAEIQDIART